MTSKKGFDFKCGKRVSERQGRGISLSLEQPWLSNKNEPAEGWEDSEQTIDMPLSGQ